ncbi:MAG: pantetheine-phosphate adenylyltransferase [Polyangiaceae bacterium]|jgi:pantetheine-phosphate adenylyltransferase|nr:pantetheine-phosphate adenylyltransferase [Polyangiaceae bacterium]
MPSARPVPESPRRDDDPAAAPGPTKAIYAGSFDPPTKGHLDLIERASALFPQLVVAVGVHPRRTALFSLEERLGLLRDITRTLANVEVSSFQGLLIDYCREASAGVIVRGLRAVTDFEYELQIAHGNADMAPEIETVFLPTRTNYGFVSGSLVREIASHGGDVSRYAEAVVCEALKAKFAARKGG